MIKKIEGKIPFLVISVPKIAFYFDWIKVKEGIAIYWETKDDRIGKILTNFQSENEFEILGKYSELSNTDCTKLVEKESPYFEHPVTKERFPTSYKSPKESLKSLLISKDLWLKEWLEKPKTIWEPESESQANEIADIFMGYEEKLNKASEEFLIILTNENTH